MGRTRTHWRRGENEAEGQRDDEEERRLKGERIHMTSTTKTTDVLKTGEIHYTQVEFLIKTLLLKSRLKSDRFAA